MNQPANDNHAEPVCHLPTYHAVRHALNDMKPDPCAPATIATNRAAFFAKWGL